MHFEKTIAPRASVDDVDPRDPEASRDRLRRARLYLCTDARRDTGDLDELLEEALAGGVDVVQLRDKGSRGEQQHGPLEAVEQLEVLATMRAACARHGALLAVNDRADIAVAAGADVLHLGQDDVPVAVARRIVGPAVVIGRSTHDEAQAAAAAAKHGVDYFCTGPCWPTPTKPGRPAPGLDLVRATAALGPERPWFAIGGIDVARMAEVVAAGATRVVVVRAITAAADPRAAARELRSALG